MKKAELLVKGQKYAVRSQFGEYPNLVFTGLGRGIRTNGDYAILACFKDVQQGEKLFFDISVPSTQVKKV